MKLWAEWTEKQKLNFREGGTFNWDRIENLRKELVEREKYTTTRKFVDWKVFGRWAK